jgi:hypothetical protein
MPDNQTTSERSPDVVESIQRIPLLRLAISSAGAIGCLVALGYLVQIAQQTLLGINVPAAQSTSDIAAIGGDFLVECVEITWRHPIVSTCMLLILIIGAAAADRLRRHFGEHPQRTWIVLSFAVLLAFAIKSIILDLPVMQMRDILTKPPICESEAIRLGRVHDTWERLLCSRAAGPEGATLRSRLTEIGITCRPRTFLTTWRSGHSPFGIEEQFAIDLFISVLLGYLAILICVSPPTGPEALPLTTAILRQALVIALVLNVVAVPFVYGKVIRSTRFPSGRIIFNSLNDQLQITPRNVTMLLIGYSDKTVTIYDTEAKVFRLLDRPRVIQIAIDGSKDLIAERMVYFFDSSKCE